MNLEAGDVTSPPMSQKVYCDKKRRDPVKRALVLISALLKQGATLMVCPGCLKAAGKSREDVADGIQIADKNAFFDFTKGRILTLDY